jgi:hypothetical protein
MPAAGMACRGADAISAMVSLSTRPRWAATGRRSASHAPREGCDLGFRRSNARNSSVERPRRRRTPRAARRLLRGDGHPHRDLEPVERGEGVDVGRVVAGRRGPPAGRAPRSDAAPPSPCASRPAAAPRGSCGRSARQALPPGRLRDRVEPRAPRCSSSATAEVEGHREPFTSISLGGHGRRPRTPRASPPAVGLRLELEPVRADADDAVHAERARTSSPAPR